MLKKRNIAMVMAAATVATSVAPAFAATLDGTTVSLSDNENMTALRAEIKALLDTTYTTKSEDLLTSTNVGKCAYTIKVKKNDTVANAASGGTEITSMRDLEKEISTLEKENDYLSISVVDNGHTEVDGKIVDWKVSEYDKTTIAKISVDSAVGKVVMDATSKTAQITMLNNDEPMYLTVGDVEIDPAKPIYKKDDNGNFLDKDGKITTIDTDKVVIGFEKKKNSIESDDKETFKGFTVKYAEQNEDSLTTAELLNPVTGRLTRKGNELAKYIRDYNAKIAKLVADKIPGFVDGDKIDAADIVKQPNKISLMISVPKNVESASTRAAGDFATIIVKGAEDEIDELKTKLDAVATTGKVETLAGNDRIQTAIEVSKDTFEVGGATNSDQNIVLVSDQVIADGLAATPFASAVNAPVLLTNKDAISEELMTEIERVLGDDGKVYLVGGESVLTTKLEAQLDSKFIEFERIAGKDRQGTSLEIAKKMSKLTDVTGVETLFVAGGYAEADTMSVAGVAANPSVNKVSPILLAGANGLTDEQVNWIKFNAKDQDAYIIGGESHVSKEAQAKLDNLTTGDVKRLAGAGRQETNAQVIKEFYENDDTKFAVGSIEDLYIVKSDNKGLVDALSAGVAAANAGAPVVLATDELVKEQKSVLETLNDSSDKEFADTVNMKQVGYGIADKVWEAIKGIL
ncbi:cell wall-binding repeat-containing protein [Romboutsia ilealis]|uniref:cell wall-binding repeat-containing protein n=1 Tax=Romboutsia ilealis TaxID=1115758 RepID=UPI0028A021B4|nr:cell wall-binding repeat-containing protein [Romboutsia ilealis]